MRFEMNSLRRIRVEGHVMTQRNRAWLGTVMAITAAAPALAGCIDVSGGAVELSWSLRSTDGVRRGCDSSWRLDTARVRLVCQTTDPTPAACDLGPGGAFPDWECLSYAGSTAFNIPEGTYQFKIEVICAGTDVAELDVTVPAPIVRDIFIGEIAQLNALLIELPIDGQTPTGGCL